MRLVMDRQPLAELWVGADFALGRGRRGSLSVLSEIGVAYSWALHIVPPLRYEGQIVSSTAIRTLLAAGAVRGAGDLLGRTYGVPAEITPAGEACVSPERALPRAGIYDVEIRQDTVSAEVKITVLPTPGHLGFESPPTFHPGPAQITFLRRGD
jgi:riboflavin kinase/FMN adenylyltransferase